MQDFFAVSGFLFHRFGRILNAPQGMNELEFCVETDDAAENAHARIGACGKKAGSIPVQTQKLRDNIYMLYGPGGNMIVLTGSEGKVLVDSSFATAAPHVTATLSAIDAKPLKLLIKTHWRDQRNVWRKQTRTR